MTAALFLCDDVSGDVVVLTGPEGRHAATVRRVQVGEAVDLADGQEVEVAGTRLTVLHTPGHAPGAVCFHAPDLGCVFTGDTLFQGGPGATGRSFSDYDTIVASIRARLFALPADTVVHTGHGPDTTIGAEKANV